MTITGVVAGALIDGQELVYKAHRGSDGSLKGAMILQVEKRGGDSLNPQRASSGDGEAQR